MTEKKVELCCGHKVNVNYPEEDYSDKCGIQLFCSCMNYYCIKSARISLWPCSDCPKETAEQMKYKNKQEYDEAHNVKN